MTREGALKGLLKAKVVALLHDPPYKLWVITAAFDNVGRVIARMEGVESAAGQKVKVCEDLMVNVPKGRRAHEREALALIHRVAVEKGLLSGGEVSRYWGVAREADNLASAFDRWPLPAEASKEDAGAVVAPEALVNPLNPAFKLPLRNTPEVSKICEYIRKLAEAVGDAYNGGGLRLAYHTLYALLEPLWYLTVGRYPSPADTRVPTHTVFDHLYASAAMVNWVYPGGEACGALLHVDLAAVQEWVSAARRTGDMWAASWLASALAWAAVRPIVEEYGPDVMLIPTARLNPFYLAWLHNELVERGASSAAETLRDVLEGLGLLGTVLKALGKEKDVKLIPMHPVMPVTMTLIVPCPREGCGEELAGRVRDSLGKAWEELVEDLASNLSEDYRDLLDAVKEEPPLPLRVVVTRVCLGDESLRRFVARAGKAADLAGGGAKAERRLLFPYVLAMQARDARASKLANVRPGVAYSVTLTTRAWGRGERYDECTMCGVRPALPDDALEPLRLEGFVDEAEHLCPYCLAKRLAWWVMLPSMGKLIHEGLVALKNFRPRVPPVNVLASADAVAELCRLAGRECRRLSDVAEFLDELDKAYREAGLLRLEGREVGRIYDLLEAYFRGDAREVVIGKLVEALGKLGKNMDRGAIEKAMSLSGRYYALIVADSDSVGDALWGRLGYDGEDAVRYWGEVLSAVRDEAARRLMKPGDLAGAARSVAEAMDEVSGAHGARGRAPVVVPTPAYLFALSMSLMATALVDSMVAEAYWGVPVYAGGDDLVVLAPARSLAVAEALLASASSYARERVYGVMAPRIVLSGSLRLPISSVAWADLVAATRRWFWALDSAVRGFYLLSTGGLMPVAAPAGLGRSYAVLLAHYREPLRLKVEAARLLERYAKEAAGNGGVEWKDAVAVGYGRGGAPGPGEAGLFRNTPPKTPLQLAGQAHGAVGLPAAVTAAITLLLAARRGGRLGERAARLARESLALNPAYSASLLYDLEASVREVVALRDELAELMLVHVAERNVDAEGEDERRRYAERIAKALREASKYWPPGAGEGLAGLLRALHYSRTAYG